MEVKHATRDKKGRFFIEASGKEIATMSYVFAGDMKFIIEHTVVDPEYEGKGLGRQLLGEAVGFAREKGYKIMPLCTYAKAVFDKTPDYSDVLF